MVCLVSGLVPWQLGFFVGSYHGCEDGANAGASNNVEEISYLGVGIVGVKPDLVVKADK